MKTMHDKNSPAPPFGPNLESLVWPLSIEEFLGEYWNKHCFASHGGAARLSELGRTINPDNIPKILAEASSHSALRLAGQSGGAPVTQNRTALELYESSDASLYIHLYKGLADQDKPKFQKWKKWIMQISSDLGRLDNIGDVSIYASKKSLGLKPHFDPNDNYTIQLSGRKRWYYSDDAAFPAANHTSGTAFKEGERLDQHILTSNARHYVHDVHSIPVPSEWQSVVLEPGSMLYVPRGFWHWTESLETSISLNISIKPGHWGNYLFPFLEQLMMSDPEWRETAHFADLGSTKATIERLLDKLTNTIADLEATDVLPVTLLDKKQRHVTEQTILRHRPLSQYYVLYNHGVSDDAQVLIVDLRGHTSMFKFPRNALQVLEWIDSQDAPFALADVKERLVSMALNPERFIENLIRADYIEQVN